MLMSLPFFLPSPVQANRFLAQAPVRVIACRSSAGLNKLIELFREITLQGGDSFGFGSMPNEPFDEMGGPE